MKNRKMTLRQMLFLLAVIVMVIALVVASGYSFDNPTQRRTSSGTVIVDTTNTGSTGVSAEEMLARDLGIIRNDSNAGERICICPSAQATNHNNRCITVVVVQPNLTGCHIPDFVTSRFIADSKNVSTLQTSTQLQAFAHMATELGVPLWLYVRVDSEVSASVIRLTEETGGGVVHYFRQSGQFDPITVTSMMVAVFSGGVIVVILFGHRLPVRRKKITKAPTKPPKSPINSPEDLARRTRERAQRDIDEADSRLDH